jgi:hypothetical protein
MGSFICVPCCLFSSIGVHAAIPLGMAGRGSRYPGQRIYGLTESHKMSLQHFSSRGPVDPYTGVSELSSGRMELASFTALDGARYKDLAAQSERKSSKLICRPLHGPNPRSLDAALSTPYDRMSLPASLTVHTPDVQSSTHTTTYLNVPGNRVSLPQPLLSPNPDIARLNQDRLRALSYLERNRADQPATTHRPGLTPGLNFLATVKGPVPQVLNQQLVESPGSDLPAALRVSLPPPRRHGYRLPQRRQKYRLPQRPSTPPTLEKIRKLLMQDPTGHAACTSIITGLDLHEAIENGGPEYDAAVDGLNEILSVVIGEESALKIVRRHMKALLAEMSRGVSIPSSGSSGDFVLGDVPGMVSHPILGEVGDFLELKLSSF